MKIPVKNKEFHLGKYLAAGAETPVKEGMKKRRLRGNDDWKV